MADFANNDGATFSAINSTVGIGPHTLEVIKFKPAAVSPTGEPGYALGDRNPKVHIDGRVEIENGTFSVRAAQWNEFAAAEVDIASGRTAAPISVTLVHPNGSTLTYNHRAAKIRKIAPSELDSGTTSEATIDIEFFPLGVSTGERAWT